MPRTARHARPGLGEMLVNLQRRKRCQLAGVVRLTESLTISRRGVEPSAAKGAAHASRSGASPCDVVRRTITRPTDHKMPQAPTRGVVVRDLPRFHEQFENGAAGTRTQNQQIMSLLQ